MSLAGFEPAIPASEWPQTYALDGTVTGIGVYNNYVIVNTVLN
jgi:hypothetical protein